jgi:pimeloyl-ACP methyl ester carboxylesterase
MVGGTAQWLDSWAGHLPTLARDRQCLLYEARGQAGGMRGGLPPLDLSDCTLSQHANDFWSVVSEARRAGLLRSGCTQELDVLGFSFGGRVAMAAALKAGLHDRPKIRRLCLTGVAGDRGPAGRLALASWRASLAAADLHGFAWNLILDTHSSAYLAKQ